MLFIEFCVFCIFFYLIHDYNLCFYGFTVLLVTLLFSYDNYYSEWPYSIGIHIKISIQGEEKLVKIFALHYLSLSHAPPPVKILIKYYDDSLYQTMAL